MISAWSELPDLRWQLDEASNNLNQPGNKGRDVYPNQAADDSEYRANEAEIMKHVHPMTHFITYETIQQCGVAPPHVAVK
jgi:hypothetical protein